MPGFDGTGPMGMGPMIGGARGLCNPYSRSFVQRYTGSYGGGAGRGRGYRHMYWATGLPGWMRFSPAGPGVYSPPYTREQEAGFLKDQAAILKEQMDAIDQRLRELESEDKKAE